MKVLKEDRRQRYERISEHSESMSPEEAKELQSAITKLQNEHELALNAFEDLQKTKQKVDDDAKDTKASEAALALQMGTTSIKEERDSCQIRLGKLETEIKTIQAVTIASEKERETDRSRLVDLEMKVEQDANRSRISQLGSEIDLLREDRDRRESHIAQMEDEIATLQTKEISLRQERDAGQAYIARMESEMEGLQGEAMGLKWQILTTLLGVGFAIGVTMLRQRKGT
jgi:chromosome segregation ATPase